MFCEEILLEALPKGFLPGEKKTMWNWPRALSIRVDPSCRALGQM